MGSKYTTDVEHVLRFYAFVSSPNPRDCADGDGTTHMVRCVAITESPSFTLYSRRRKCKEEKVGPVVAIPVGNCNNSLRAAQQRDLARVRDAASLLLLHPVVGAKGAKAAKGKRRGTRGGGSTRKVSGGVGRSEGAGPKEAAALMYPVARSRPALHVPPKKRARVHDTDEEDWKRYQAQAGISAFDSGESLRDAKFDRDNSWPCRLGGGVMDSALYPRPSAANAANRSGTAQVCCGMATAINKIDQRMAGAHPMSTKSKVSTVEVDEFGGFSIESAASDLARTAHGLLILSH